MIKQIKDYIRFILFGFLVYNTYLETGIYTAICFMLIFVGVELRNKERAKLEEELALALEVASIAQAWGNPSPFQNKINELLVKAGRKPVKPRTEDKK